MKAAGSMLRTRFAEPIAEPEPEEVRSRIGRTQGLTDTQIHLDELMYDIQNDTSFEEGYFIYLIQNEDNPKNPYDLVPFLPYGENKQDGAQSQTPRRSRSQEKHH